MRICGFAFLLYLRRLVITTIMLLWFSTRPANKVKKWKMETWHGNTGASLLTYEAYELSSPSKYVRVSGGCFWSTVVGVGGGRGGGDTVCTRSCFVFTTSSSRVGLGKKGHVSSSSGGGGGRGEREPPRKGGAHTYFGVDRREIVCAFPFVACSVG